ncbi:MAG: YncE family protein [Granulosicoccus sp.]
MNMMSPKTTATRTGLAVLSLLALSACSSSAPPTTTVDPNTTSFAFASTRASDYGAYRVDRISLSNGNTVNGSYPATDSDTVITTDGTDLYQIGRFGTDSVTRFDPVDTSIVDYQYSVNVDGEPSANPQTIAFLSKTKAYLTRYGSDALWIINPDASSEDAFKIGEIDLSAYDTDVPNMTDAIIVGSKLFVLLERLEGFTPTKVAYLVVIDTQTDTEIQTNQGRNGLAGIELSVVNPTALQYNETTGEIYVVGRGNYFENSAVTTEFHSGGIEVIDPDSYEHSVLLDDGTDAENQGYFVDAEIVNTNLGYLLTYASFGVTTLRTFNPTTGLLSEELFEGLQSADITTLAQGPDNHLWVGIAGATNGYMRIDLVTGDFAGEIVTTELVPSGLQFINIPEAE